MSAAPALAVSWIWILLLSGAGALPLGGAPLPPDPTLSNIAPPKCLWYASYAGQGPASADSDNQTEQLFAEPQVQQFIEEIESQIVKAVRRAAGPDRHQRVLAEHLPKLVKVVLTRPLAAYVEDVQLIQGGQADDNLRTQRFDVSGALVLHAGDNRQQVQDSIDELLTLIPPDKPQVTTEEVAGLQWRRVPTPPDAPTVRFGWKDDYLIVALGEQTPQQVLERMAGSPPEWLTKLREEHPVARELSVAYLNIEGILSLARTQIEAQNADAWPTIEKLGLTSIVAVHAVSGFDDVGCVSLAHLVTKDGSRPGILSLLPHAPLESADLTPIPSDALIALAASIDAAEVFDNAVKVASRFDPKAEEQIQQELWRAEDKLGVNLRDDVLAALDDAWVAYLPAGDLMISWLNTTVAVKVKDAEKLRDAVDHLVLKAMVEMARQPNPPSIVETEIDGRTLYTLQFNQPAPVAPSWCVGDDWLVAGLSPQAVRAALDRNSENSLAGVDEVSAVFEAEGRGPAVLAYQDTPRLVRSLYPWLTMGLQMAGGELRRQGVDFNAATLPTQDVIVKHLRPSVATMSHHDDGFYFASHSSLPGGGNMAAAAPVGLALLLPAVHAARQAARDTQDMNDMKQIMLGILNYESAHGRWPTDVYSDEGKPLLSWRVQILPYLEEQTAYDRFNLDEPWDSPANKQVLDQMPEVFRSSTAPGVANETQYLAITGPDSVFPGNEKMSFASIMDGSSNTLAVVQSAPEAAVEWTKPADLAFDGDKPFAKLGSPEGYFLAAFCDGSVRRISLAIGDEVMKRLANRRDGELIDHEVLSAPPAPHLYTAEPADDAARPDDAAIDLKTE